MGHIGEGQAGRYTRDLLWEREQYTIYMLFLYPKYKHEDLTSVQLRVLSRLVREEFK